MDGRASGIGRRGRTVGALALAILLWPLGGQANIPRVPFQELPREALPDLPFAVRWHARRDGETEQRTIELARVPRGAVRIPTPPARLDD
ncbi:MAG: hypothetical protein V2J24_17475 [Pseudomonadales bacterium]|jgi:hypothetical protein|nr:hypothetical protein [Pseudomonadales bacterium]